MFPEPRGPRRPSASSEFDKIIADDFERWAPLMRDLNLKSQ